MKSIILFVFLTGCATTQQTQQKINHATYITSALMTPAAMVVYSIRNFHP